MIIEILEIMFAFLFLVMLAYLVRHYIFTVTVLRNADKPKKTITTPCKTNFEPSVTILIPAKNEEKVIGRLLKRLTELTYPKNKLQVIVINDASSDNTSKIATEYKNLYTFIDVLNRDAASGGSGKAAAMNEGLSKSQGEIILCFDADYYPQRDIVERLSSAFVDPKVGAVQGRVVVLNEPENIVTRLVALERVGGYRVDQEARNNLGLITQFGGTVGGFRSSVLRGMHGWDESVLAEDTDLTFKLYLAGYTVKYDVDAECYEEAVNNWRAYWRQRYRWSKGHMQCFFRHFWNVIKTDKLSAKQKIDGTLLLNVYFMPIIAFMSLVIGLYLLLSPNEIESFVPVLWLMIPISLYSFVGNFAPFFEVGVGLYLDGRKRTQWLIPLSLFTFLYNVPMCTLAFLDVVFARIRRKDNHVWAKTNHSGNGNHYVNKHTLKADIIWD